MIQSQLPRKKTRNQWNWCSGIALKSALFPDRISPVAVVDHVKDGIKGRLYARDG